MPATRISPDLEMHYLIDDYTDPWREAETILMLHGNGENSVAWFAWVPHLARRFRVVRPDMRGFGASTPMPRDYPWSIDGIIDDYVRLMQTLGIACVHLVGSKLGGTVARCFAARRPEFVRTLTVAGTPPPRRDLAARISAWTVEFETQGIEHWARRTMSGRLGSRFPPAGVEWWIKMMGRTPVSSQIGFTQKILTSDITPDLARIACPTLVITTEGSALGSVEETRAWQQQIPRSTLLVLPGDSFHVAASDPDRCARATFDFISRAGAGAD
jgi:3-oxoadipate enol-lactonase